MRRQKFIVSIGSFSRITRFEVLGENELQELLRNIGLKHSWRVEVTRWGDPPQKLSRRQIEELIRGH